MNQKRLFRPHRRGAAEVGIVVDDLCNLRALGLRRRAGEPKRRARPSAICATVHSRLDEIRIGLLIRALEQDHALAECFRADGGGCVLTPAMQVERDARGGEGELLRLSLSSTSGSAS